MGRSVIAFEHPVLFPPRRHHVDPNRRRRCRRKSVESASCDLANVVASVLGQSSATGELPRGVNPLGPTLRCAASADSSGGKRDMIEQKLDAADIITNFGRHDDKAFA